MLLRRVLGKVIEFYDDHKAIVLFINGKVFERAWLPVENMVINEKTVQLGEKVTDHLRIGTLVEFTCRPVNGNPSRCKWYIIFAKRQEERDIWASMPSDSDVLAPRSTFGLLGEKGTVCRLAPNQGVIVFRNHENYGRREYVVFLASRCYVKGKKLDSRCRVDSVLKLSDVIYFDAIPTDPSENDTDSSWFATVAWTGERRPQMHYDGPQKPMEGIFDGPSLISEMRRRVSSPKGYFLLTSGIVGSIINEDIGVAIINTSRNCYESAIFHKSVCYLFKMCLSEKRDLRSFFKKGDRIKFIGVAAPKELPFRWMALQISVHVGRLLDL